MFDTNKFLKGTSGEVFLNETKLIEINKVNIKMTGQFEDFAPTGDYNTHHVFTGFDGEGTLEGARINSGVDIDIINNWQKGVSPIFTIYSSLSDPNTGKTERYMVTGVQFNEVTPQDWEAKTLAKRSMPFTFTGIKVMDELK